MRLALSVGKYERQEHIAVPYYTLLLYLSQDALVVHQFGTRAMRRFRFTKCAENGLTLSLKLVSSHDITCSKVSIAE